VDSLVDRGSIEQGTIEPSPPSEGCGDTAAVAGELEAWPADTDAFPVWRSGKQSWRVAFDVNVPGETPCPRLTRAG